MRMLIGVFSHRPGATAAARESSHGRIWKTLRGLPVAVLHMPFPRLNLPFSRRSPTISGRG